MNEEQIPASVASAPPLIPAAAGESHLVLEGLNNAQRLAASTIDGPLLLIAGAGSGKTRTIVHRIAYMVSRGVDPGEILAVTFTNKAAGELKQRVAGLLTRAGIPSVRGPLVSTFHSFCARVLRHNIVALGKGYSSRFAIYDQADSLKVLKTCLRDAGRAIDGADALQARISAAKNTRIASAEELAGQNARPPDEAFAARIRCLYDERLRRNNALDFDDLLRLAVALLRLPSIGGFYSSRYLRVMVDEYQDTNRLQFEIIRLLCARHRNICVVGDDAQGIYGFRGADLRIILNFERLFPGARTVKLERNYRSTARLVEAANSLIAHNRQQIPKAVYTQNYLGEPIALYEAADEHDEAEFVAREIAASLGVSQSRKIGILYRTNGQSRALEIALGRSRVPYNLVGGTSLYDRKEVRDLLSYLRLAANPEDELAFERAMTSPSRGVGQKTLDYLALAAAENRCSRWAVAARLVKPPLAGGSDFSLSLSPRLRSALADFVDIAERVCCHAAADRLVAAIETAFTDSGYRAVLARAEGGEARIRNVKDLMTAAAVYDQRRNALQEFLDQTALVSDQDEYERNAPVTLMTVHAAKGLEFDTVFVVGLEEGLFPHQRSLGVEKDEEEERRLFYVAMTRAVLRLFLSHARQRNAYGKTVFSQPSRFLEELPARLVVRV